MGKKKIEMIRNRAKALYHNCHSTACFKRSDSTLIEDEQEACALRREASAYEVVAGWIDGLIKII